jgi:hypothetical protein
MVEASQPPLRKTRRIGNHVKKYQDSEDDEDDEDEGDKGPEDEGSESGEDEGGEDSEGGEVTVVFKALQRDFRMIDRNIIFNNSSRIRAFLTRDPTNNTGMLFSLVGRLVPLQYVVLICLQVARVAIVVTTATTVIVLRVATSVMTGVTTANYGGMQSTSRLQICFTCNPSISCAHGDKCNNKRIQKMGRRNNPNVAVHEDRLVAVAGIKEFDLVSEYVGVVKPMDSVDDFTYWCAMPNLVNVMGGTHLRTRFANQCVVKPRTAWAWERAWWLTRARMATTAASSGTVKDPMHGRCRPTSTAFCA